VAGRLAPSRSAPPPTDAGRASHLTLKRLKRGRSTHLSCRLDLGSLAAISVIGAKALGREPRLPRLLVCEVVCLVDGAYSQTMSCIKQLRLRIGPDTGSWSPSCRQSA
jgi:hypothetical protein